MRILPLVFCLSACWSDFEAKSIDQVAFQNTHWASDSAVVTTYELKLQCPDGENARFYTVHDTSVEGPMTAAVVLHSSAFDYVKDPVAESPLMGSHFADKFEDTHRLAQDWGVLKVWETLGMYPQIESTENNTGALPAALVEAGVVAFYPINCWGDLWHNTEIRTNDQAAEFFPRWGGTFASWMSRLAQEPEFAALQGVEFDFEISDAGLHLIGLGDGARGIISILKGENVPTIAGIFVDSPVDDLSYWAEDSVFSEEATGLSRIFNYTDSPPDWNSWTLRALVNQGHADGAKVAMAYSETDPRVPYPEASFKNMIVSINAHAQGLLLASASPSHVLSNQDPVMARQVVNFLLGREDEEAEADTP